MDSIASRFFQARREARWSFALAVLYLIAWVGSAYFLDSTPGVTGLPRWFEWSCLFLPMIFMVLCALMVRWVFKEVSLELDPMASEAADARGSDEA